MGFEEPFPGIDRLDTAYETKSIGTTGGDVSLDPIDHANGFGRHRQPRRGIDCWVLGVQRGPVDKLPGHAILDFFGRRRIGLVGRIAHTLLPGQCIPRKKSKVSVTGINPLPFAVNFEIKMFDDHVGRF